MSAAAMKCPKCGRVAGIAPDTCRCSWEEIAMAYDAQGEKNLAVLAWHIAAHGATGRAAPPEENR